MTTDSRPLTPTWPHQPSPHTDYVAIPPLKQTVCFHCEVGDGYQEWPCESERWRLAANPAPAGPNMKTTDWYDGYNAGKRDGVACCAGCFCEHDEATAASFEKMFREHDEMAEQMKREAAARLERKG